jgi:imidazolonepropionase-like amidohydrolase
MGIDDHLGTIENGKTADLVLVDKNPLENISVLTDPDNIKMVIKDGKAALNS